MVYRPGSSTATATPPARSYLRYLFSQRTAGAQLSDRVTTTVAGRPATLVTVASKTAVDGSLGCPSEALSAGDCFGPQPDLVLRIAVIPVRDQVLLVWLRMDAGGTAADRASAVKAFERWLTTLRLA